MTPIITFCLVMTILVVGATTDERIAGGVPVNIEDVPYQISIQVYGWPICGGTLLDKQMVLTAAHCFYRRDARSIRIRVGSANFGEGGVLVNVTHIHVHPKFDHRTLDFDFAIIELEDYNTTGVVYGITQLPTDDMVLDDGTELVVSGWGRSQNVSWAQTQLRAVTVQKVSQESCNRSYWSDLTAQMICAGNEEGGKDACQGDSGGPLVHNETQTVVGVVSWGYWECAAPGYPVVYARVQAARQWIQDITGL